MTQLEGMSYIILVSRETSKDNKDVSKRNQ